MTITTTLLSLALSLHVTISSSKKSIMQVDLISTPVYQKNTTSPHRRHQITDKKHYFMKLSNISAELCVIFSIHPKNCTCNTYPNLCNAYAMFSTVLAFHAAHNQTYIRSNLTTTVYASISLSVAVLGVLGNLVVIYIAYEHRTTISPCNLHIAELAFVNLIFSVAQIINTTPLFWTNTWVYSLTMCKVIRSLIELASFLTIAFIQMIAIERYQLVVTPVKSHASKGRCQHVMVIIAFVCVFASVIPYFTWLDIETGTGRCIVNQNNKKSLIISYNALIFTLYSIAPICVLGRLTFRMKQSLTQKEFKKLSKEKRIQMKLCKRNRHIMYITLFIYLFFIVCTFPGRAITIYIGVVTPENINVSVYMTLTVVSYLTYPLQNTLNPVLYSMTAKNWRQTFKSKFTQTPAASIDKETML